MLRVGTCADGIRRERVDELGVLRRVDESSVGLIVNSSFCTASSALTDRPGLDVAPGSLALPERRGSDTDLRDGGPGG